MRSTFVEDHGLQFSFKSVTSMHTPSFSLSLNDLNTWNNLEKSTLVLKLRKISMSFTPHEVLENVLIVRIR